MHTVRCALRRIIGSCGAAREAQRQHMWMDGRLMAGACGVPSPTIIMTRSSRTAASSLICDAPMTGRLSAVDRAGVRRVCWAQEQLALTCPSTRCRTLWDSNFAGLLGRLRGGARSTEGRVSSSRSGQQCPASAGPTRRPGRPPAPSRNRPSIRAKIEGRVPR